MEFSSCKRYQFGAGNTRTQIDADANLSFRQANIGSLGWSGGPEMMLISQGRFSSDVEFQAIQGAGRNVGARGASAVTGTSSDKAAPEFLVRFIGFRSEDVETDGDPRGVETVFPRPPLRLKAISPMQLPLPTPITFQNKARPVVRH